MRRVIIFFAVLAPFLALAIVRESVWAAVGILFVSHALILWPTLQPTSQWLGPVVTGFETEQKEVWLTIDDGPDREDTPRILELLDGHSARATFFVKGARVKQFPDTTAEIVRRGHTIGNHSMTHPSATFWCLPPGSIAREIDDCSATIAEVAGSSPTWFRAPVGMKNPFVHPLLGQRKMKLIGWTARGFDGVRTNPAGVVKSILDNVSPGSIILAHEGRRDPSGRSLNFEILEQLVSRLAADGYSFVIPQEDRFVYGRRKTQR